MLKIERSHSGERGEMIGLLKGIMYNNACKGPVRLMVISLKESMSAF